MLIKMKVVCEMDVVTLRCQIGVRYWEDATVNGQPESDDDVKMPFGGKGVWRIDIDLASGKIADWPEGVTASTHYKVCDDGVYELIASDGQSIAKIDGYVPSMLAPNGEGYGDYVILDIGPDGMIAGWKFDATAFEGDEE